MQENEIKKTLPLPPDMVKAVKDGIKTKVLVLVCPQPDPDSLAGELWIDDDGYLNSGYGPSAKSKTDFFCPYGEVGSKLGIQEKAFFTEGDNTPSFFGGVRYASDGNIKNREYPYSCPFYLLPDWAIKNYVEITKREAVGVCNITPKDIENLGFPYKEGEEWAFTVIRFREALDNKFSKQKIVFGDNPLVWLVEFKYIGVKNEENKC